MATSDPVAPVQIAIYTRKSNDENLNGAVTSIDNQKTCCRSYIAIQREKGWREYPEVFDDPAESGKSFKRPAVQRLLKRIEEGKVQGVIVYKLDRMTRNSRDFHMLLELFEKHGVAFISATESIDTKSPQGRLMTAIMVQFAQYDREMDVERSKDFHLARARKGLWCAGLPPLGYDLKDKLLVINEKEAETVRKVFALYLQRGSTLRVAEVLNRQGYRRKTYNTLDGKLFGGKSFDKDSVIRILRRKIYIGFVTNERTAQEFPGLHKPIVAPSDFEKAQKILDSHDQWETRPSAYAANKHGFRLRGLIRCGVCGNAVVGYARPKGGKVYRYYRCLGHLNGLPARCSFKSASVGKVEGVVIEKLAAVGWNRAFLERVVREAVKRSKASVEPLAKEKRANEDRLQKVRRDIQHLLNLVKAGGASDEAAAEVGRLEKSKREMESRLLELEAMIAHRKSAVYDVDVVQGALQRFARFVGRMPIELQIQTIRLLVSKVTVWKRKVDVELHEIGVKELQDAMEGGSGGSGAGKFESRRSVKRRDRNNNAGPDFRQLGERTTVAELEQNWRGRRDLNPRSPP